MSNKYAIVITSINHPTKAVIEIANSAKKLDAQFIVIGDEKSPKDFYYENCQYFDIQKQIDSDFNYAKIAPTRHYARKNIGYLIAIKDGANIIIETDDDNIPLTDFWLERSDKINARILNEKQWVNIYSYFSKSQIWPRGLPLDKILEPAPKLQETVENIYCPIQQGLADENPDVDAIYRLILPLPFSFDKVDSVALCNTWSPFNSQNTTWFKEAYQLMYLPYYCSFRMTDIWRSFVTQRIAYENSWHILYHNSTVYQERNEHNLMRDFEDEVSGYLNNNKIRDELNNLSLKKGKEYFGENLIKCYETLIKMGLVGQEELELINAWNNDFLKIY